MTQEHPHAELSAYIDGELAPAANAAVDGHLARCAVCRAHVAQLRAAAAFVHALPDPVPSRRLVPSLGVPAWLAPLRTLMTLASGAAVFLFIASALVSNITFLAGSGAAPAAHEASRDTAVNAAAPKGAEPTATAGVAGAPPATPAPQATSPSAFSVFAPSASPLVRAPLGASGGATPDDTQKRLDQARPSPSGGDVPAALSNTGRAASSEPQRSPLLNPWLWLSLAIVCGALAIALHRRLRTTA